MGEVEHDIGIVFVVLQPDIVPRPVLLDEVALEKQGFKLSICNNKLNPFNFANQDPSLWCELRLLLEIAADTVSEVLSLSNVQDAAGAIFH